jgi:hypothetical protein
MKTRAEFVWRGCAVLALFMFAPEALAQDAPANPGGPCRDGSCKVIYDWGAGATAASYGSDRRYGAAADIEPLLKQYLGERGLRIVESGEAMLLTVRISITNAMCDQMAGTSTDMSCRTINELIIQFSSNDAAVKAPGTMRVSNRCGAGDTKMTIAQMARYAADFVAYGVAQDKKGMKRAVARC